MSTNYLELTTDTGEGGDDGTVTGGTGIGGLTYLRLCQMTVRQTGTIQGVVPTTVTGQVNRLRQVCEFVNEAWIDIQNAHRMWRWMQSQFIGQTSIGTQAYSYSAFKDEWSNSTISRFTQWGFKGDSSDTSLSCYLTSVGPQEEGALQWLDWNTFYTTQLRGITTPGKPRFYSVSPDNRLIISPPPDDVYTLRGQYRKAPQILVVDSDMPELPIQFHTIIKDAALCYVEGFDEGPRLPFYRLRMLPNFSMLEADQLPKMRWGMPLA